MSQAQRVFWACAVLLFGGVLEAAAQSQATTGVIEGTVRDDERRRPFPAPPSPAQHRHQLRAAVTRPTPTAASAACSCPSGPTASRSLSSRLRHPRPRGHRPRRRPDRQPARRASRSSTRAGRGGGHRRGAARRDHARRGLDPHRRARRSRACPTTAATSSTSPSSRPASPSCRARTATSCRSTARRASHNNISVDGADFNNPFFGEQRGGQRPAFTFNLDAVKEVVVVADGATAEFGRSSGGLRQRRHQVGHQRHSRHRAPRTSRTTASPSAPKRADGTTAPTSSTSNQQQAGFTLGGPLMKDKAVLLPGPRLPDAAARPSRPIPRASSSAWSDFFASLGSPNENGPIERTNDARVFLGKVDWQPQPQQPR